MKFLFVHNICEQHFIPHYHIRLLTLDSSKHFNVISISAKHCPYLFHHLRLRIIKCMVVKLKCRHLISIGWRSKREEFSLCKSNNWLRISGSNQKLKEVCFDVTSGDQTSRNILGIFDGNISPKVVLINKRRMIRD